MNTSRRRLAAACLLAAPALLLSGCFSASVRFWGNKPSTGVKIAAATADVATAPVQIPAFAVAKATSPRPPDPKLVAESEARLRKQQEARAASAKLIVAEIGQTPALLTDDAFWDRHSADISAATLGLLWTLQSPSTPASPEINAYLLRRFPRESGSILANGRATRGELTALAADKAQPHDIRQNAIDALLRDPGFDFGEPWRRLVIDEFPIKTQLMFGTRRYTLAELETLAKDPATPKWIRDMARDNIGRGWFKPTSELKP